MTGPITGGKRGEDTAVRYLLDRGYTIVEKNYRCRLGEIDIVALDGGILVFVEVKSRTSLKFGPPEAAVDERKQKKLSKVALHFLKERKSMDSKARFDVVAILFSPEGHQVDHFMNAFDLVE